MLSHKHKCIFVHIPKVAGISIEQVFLDDYGPDFRDKASLLIKFNEPNGPGPKVLSHLTADEYLRYGFVSEDVFKTYFKFAFVRNPYDRIYSFYKYLGYARLVSFEHFVVKGLPRVFRDPDLHFFVKPMSEYVCDASGNMLVDFIGKLETITDDFGTIARKLNLGDVRLQNLNNSKEMNYKTHLVRSWRILKKHPAIVGHASFRKAGKAKKYPERMKAAVWQYYEADFTRFGYGD